MKLVKKIPIFFNSTNNEAKITQAIEYKDWDLVLFYRRKALEKNQNSSSAWLQLGHALKECGFYSKADAAYSKAQHLSPASKEILLQRGHLKKLQGDVVSAYELYSTALSGWQGDPKNVQLEVDHIRGIAESISSRGIFPQKNSIDCAIYISTVSKIFEENDRADLSQRIGRADYSYAFALKGFANALDDLGIDYHILNDVAGISDIRLISNAKKIIHIGFYPPEKINLLKGAYNIVSFAWEFDRLRSSSENLSYNAFSDQAYMLNLADEVWVPSRHGVNSVKPSLSNNVTYMPSPAIIDRNLKVRKKLKTGRYLFRLTGSLKDISWVPLRIMPRVQDTMSKDAYEKRSSMQKVISSHKNTVENPIIYVSIFNAHDYRKNIDSLIRGFDAFSRKYPHAYLFLKLADDQKPHGGPNASLLHGQMSSPSSLVPSISSDNIWLSWDSFTRDQLNTLFDAAHFYVCSAIAEGQNLPLIESMARKCVPVSVRHTAMKDYIDHKNSVVIKSERVTAPIGFAERYKMFDITLDMASANDVYDALQRSVSITEQQYDEMALCAFHTVETVFGPERICERINELLS